MPADLQPPIFGSVEMSGNVGQANLTGAGA